MRERGSTRRILRVAVVLRQERLQCLVVGKLAQHTIKQPVIPRFPQLLNGGYPELLERLSLIHIERFKTEDEQTARVNAKRSPYPSDVFGSHRGLFFKASTVFLPVVRPTDWCGSGGPWSQGTLVRLPLNLNMRQRIDALKEDHLRRP